MALGFPYRSLQCGLNLHNPLQTAGAAPGTPGGLWTSSLGSCRSNGVSGMELSGVSAPPRSLCPHKPPALPPPYCGSREVLILYDPRWFV